MPFKDTKDGETHFVCAKHLKEDGEEAECCGCTRVPTQCSFVPDDSNTILSTNKYGKENARKNTRDSL